jgi:RNA polymerase sigma-70 factor (ECF subfamily)
VTLDPERLTELADTQLMTAIAQGDLSAFTRLYERRSGLLLALCVRILRDRSEAEDVLEEVFWELWQRRQRYDASRAAPLPYLVTLARSRALDRLRFRRRRQSVWIDSSESDAAGELHSSDGAGADPFEEALAVQQRVAIAEALGELPEPQRRAVELSFFEGLSHREIAERLGDPLGTVKTRIRQGLLALRKALREGMGRS